MRHLFESPGKPANVTVPLDLHPHANDLGINISQRLEAAPGNVVNLAKRERWAAENAGFIAEYNQRIDEQGPVLQEWNTF